jgi:hypothetical protein
MANPQGVRTDGDVSAILWPFQGAGKTKVSLPILVADLLSALDEIGIPYMVGGSYASSAWGQPRQTNDLDLAIFLSAAQVDPLVRFAEPDFLVSKSEIEDCLASTQDFRGFQLLHIEEVFKIDVFLLPNTEYGRLSMGRARPYPLGPFMARFASPEDTIITKLRWYNLGNRISDRQWNDIVQVLEIQDGSLDEAYLEKWTSHFGLLDLLREAQRQVIR